MGDGEVGDKGVELAGLPLPTSYLLPPLSPTSHFPLPTSYLPRTAPHAGDQALHVRNRRFRHHAVAEVEDVRPAAGRFENAVDAPVQSLAAGDEGERVEVALGRHPLRQGRQQDRRVEGPVEGERIADAVARDALAAGSAQRTSPSGPWRTGAD